VGVVTNVVITAATQKQGRPVSEGSTVPLKSITFRFSTDSVGVTSKTCSLDGATPITCTGSVSYDKLRPGSHTVVYTVRDAAGNSASDSFIWTTHLDTGNNNRQ
jgi:hypothetical protein